MATPTYAAGAVDTAASLSAVRSAAGSKPKRPGPLGPDAKPGAPRRNIAAPRGSTASGYKRGLPTVPSSTAQIMDTYTSLEELEGMLTAARLARNMKRRGFETSADVNVARARARGLLPVPGVGSNPPTVNPTTSQPLTAAAVTAMPGLLGQTSETPDPRTKQALAASRATSDPAEIAYHCTRSLPVGVRGEAASVTSTRTPAGPALVAYGRQLPARMADTEIRLAAMVTTAETKTRARVSAFRKPAAEAAQAQVDGSASDE